MLLYHFEDELMKEHVNWFDEPYEQYVRLVLWQIIFTEGNQLTLKGAWLFWDENCIIFFKGFHIKIEQMNESMDHSCYTVILYVTLSGGNEYH